MTVSDEAVYERALTKIIEGLTLVRDTLSAQIPIKTTESGLSSVSGPGIPVAEKHFRHALIIDGLINAETDDMETLQKIARYYGYSQNRGVAGFFRIDATGLLKLNADGTITVTTRGLKRHIAQEQRVADYYRTHGVPKF